MIGIHGGMLQLILMFQGGLNKSLKLKLYVDCRPLLVLFFYSFIFPFLCNILFFYFRDFAAANKIGAKGLLGRSWPDLDMLPLGWLTDPGDKN